ncbi:GyrI-like domain-containing protein [Parendozoicomonas haliclonae]|uniref:GyrI-like small molecule binding domain-containing protein n=1 Tax=Parendozoicomonas haliclonae TaxID=1960125 RepID=A0A1X7ANU4_9GAMM|nr:GyrI-like domain-containing protein [Parendozoicomonas haliclonae]SMA49956.1 hypothetical protein EHSB41UT_03747 [Parendozoicomonas haliclonae]
MNLPASILSTIAICAVVFSAVLFQPVPLSAAETVVQPEKPAAQYPDVHILAGITKQVPMTEINSLWQEFYAQTGLHELVSNKQPSIYVLYQDISEGFDNARITIGYDVRDLKSTIETQPVPRGSYQTLLPAGKYSHEELYGWSDLDYSKGTEAILEQHKVDPSGQVISTSLLVLYR